MKRTLTLVAITCVLALAAAPNLYAGECEGDECTDNCEEEQSDSSLVCQAKCKYSEAWGSLCESDETRPADSYCWQVFQPQWPFYSCHDGAHDPCCEADGGDEGDEGGF